MTEQETNLNPSTSPQPSPEGEGDKVKPQPRYDYRAMFAMLAYGRAQKVCRQEGRTAWIISVDGNYYREVYDTKTWLVHYDLLSNEEFQVVVDELLPSVTPSVEGK